MAQPVIEAGVQETRPGVRTTEFWSTLTLNALGTIQLIAGPIDVQNKWVLLGMAIVGGTYNGSRGLAKQGVSNS